MSTDCHTMISVSGEKERLLALFNKFIDCEVPRRKMGGNFSWKRFKNTDEMMSTNEESEEEYYRQWGQCSCSMPSLCFNMRPTLRESHDVFVLTIDFYTVHNYPIPFIEWLLNYLVSVHYTIENLIMFDDGNECEHYERVAILNHETFESAREYIMSIEELCSIDEKIAKEKKEKEMLSKDSTKKNDDLPF